MSLKRSSVIHQVYVLKNILEMLLLALYIPLNLIFCFEVENIIIIYTFQRK
jgi:hypothetical protein